MCQSSIIYNIICLISSNSNVIIITVNQFNWGGGGRNALFSKDTIKCKNINMTPPLLGPDDSYVFYNYLFTL